MLVATARPSPVRKNSRRLRVPAALLVCLLAAHASGHLWAQDPPKTEERIEEVGRRIEQRRQQIESVQQQESQALEKLDTIDRDLSKSTEQYARMTATITGLQERVAGSRTALDALTKDRILKEEQLNRRLVASYKYYRRGGVKMLLSAPGYTSFLRTENFLRQALASDRNLFRECTRLIQAETAAQESMNARLEEYLQARETIVRQRDGIRRARGEKASLLETIRREKSLQLKALEELEQYAREVQRFVDSIPAAPVQGPSQQGSFAARMGSLTIPLPGRVITTFGRKAYPDLQTSTFQKGIEIECPADTEIRAVFGGTVVFAGWFKGYGNTLIIDHGESYFSLIAHASRLLKSVGDRVNEGEVIALSGDTGSLKGALLYFEIRHHGKPQDPLRWLSRDVS